MEGWKIGFHVLGKNKISVFWMTALKGKNNSHKSCTKQPSLRKNGRIKEKSFSQGGFYGQGTREDSEETGK